MSAEQVLDCGRFLDLQHAFGCFSIYDGRLSPLDPKWLLRQNTHLMHARAHTHTHTHTHACMHSCTRAHARRVLTHARTHACTHVRGCPHKHTHTHTHTHTHKQTHRHTHTHTHTHWSYGHMVVRCLSGRAGSESLSLIWPLFREHALLTGGVVSAGPGEAGGRPGRRHPDTPSTQTPSQECTEGAKHRRDPRA